MTVVDRFVQAVSHGGAMRPTLQVVHSAETPLRAGYAASIAENWFGRSAPTSAHFMVDPVELIRMLSDNVVAYAVGPAANGFTLNWEQAGYARFSRAEWTTDDGMAQMDKLAAGVRERGLANGIPLRWASDDDIRAAARGVPGGICFHDDIRRVLGGTTHSDPMPNYPRDLLMERVQRGSTPAAQVHEEDDDMRVIQSKGRGIALVGPGYFRPLDQEQAEEAVGLYGKARVGNDRQFDVWKAIHLQGTSAVAGQLAAVAAQVKGVAPADVDEAALAELLAPKLTGVPPAQIAEALRQVLREGVGTATA